MTILMFYRQAIPLNRDSHRQLRVRPGVGGFAYAAATNSVPLAGIEFADACRSFPIVFADPATGGGFPLALLGLRQDENLFVDGEGKWLADYIPAFVRRYPFVLQEQLAADNFTVLFDQAYTGFGTDQGEPLFLADGQDSPAMARIIDFLTNYQAEVARTRDFIARLDEAQLLVPKAIQAALGGAAPLVIEGFRVVDEQKLLALDDARLLALARSGDLGRIYAHLVSLGTLPGLVGHLQSRLTTMA